MKAMIDYEAMAKKFGGTPVDSPVDSPVDTSAAPSTQGNFDVLARSLGGNVSDTSQENNNVLTGGEQTQPKKEGLITKIARVVTPIGESIGNALAVGNAKKMEADTSARASQLANTASAIIRNPKLSAEAKRRALTALQKSQGANVIESSGAFNETPLQTIGKGLGTAAAFLGGEGASAVGKLGVTGLKGLAAKALAEGALGATTVGAGTALAQGESGADAAKTIGGVGILSASIPVVGQIVGQIVGKGIPALSRALEKSSLRLTPVQKTELFTKINGVSDWIRSNKIVGTPEARFEQASKIVNDYEEQFQNFLKTKAKDVTIPRDQVLSQLDALKSGFVNDADSLAIDKQIDNIKKTLEKKFPEAIPVDRLNALKRSTYQQAFNQAGTKVRDDVEHAAADVFRKNIEESVAFRSINGQDVGPFNQEYGKAIMAKKLLKTAMGRPEVGLVGRLIAGSIGTAIGALSPVGGGIGQALGAAAGGSAGQYAAKALVGTVPRSIASRGLTLAENAAKPIGSALRAKGVNSVVGLLKAHALSSLAGGYGSGPLGSQTPSP